MLSKKRITKSDDQTVPLSFAYGKSRFCHDVAHYVFTAICAFGISLVAT